MQSGAQSCPLCWSAVDRPRRAVLQEIVDENAEHVVTPQQQYDPSAEVDVEGREYVINYGQIYLSKPTMTEADGETGVLFPKEARLRNLT